MYQGGSPRRIIIYVLVRGYTTRAGVDLGSRSIAEGERSFEVCSLQKARNKKLEVKQFYRKNKLSLAIIRVGHGYVCMCTHRLLGRFAFCCQLQAMQRSEHCGLEKASQQHLHLALGDSNIGKHMWTDNFCSRLICYRWLQPSGSIPMQ